jgi:uncharacterized RDD family membrane protein YckC
MWRPTVALAVLTAVAVVLIARANGHASTPGVIAFCWVTALPIALTVIVVGRAWRERNAIATTTATGGGSAELVLAWMIDVTVPFVVALLVETFSHYARESVGILPDGAFYEPWGISGVITLWVLNFVVLQSLTGRTVGKQLLGLQTVRREGGRPPLWSTSLRTVSVFPLLGPLPGLIELAFVVKRGDRIGDRVGHTRVVAS